MCIEPDPEEDFFFMVICAIVVGTVFAVAGVSSLVKFSDPVEPQRLPNQIFVEDSEPG